jgi:EpsI family protein
MISKTRLFTVCCLLLAASVYITFHSDILVPMNRHFDEFPARLKSWRMVSQSELDEQTLDILKPTDYLLRTYEGNGGIVQLYIGYHGGGQNSGEIHSPKHCLPGSGWCEVSGGRMELDIGGKKIELTKALYEKGGGKDLFYYWYQAGDHSLSNEVSLKLAQIGNSILHRRRDAAFVRISVPVHGSEEQSAALGRQFIEDFYEVIKGFLPA